MAEEITVSMTVGGEEITVLLDTAPRGPAGSDAEVTAENIAAAGGALLTDVEEVANDLTTHAQDTANPHAVTKSQVGLSNVDNTSDANKPVSTAQATAITAAATSPANALTALEAMTSAQEESARTALDSAEAQEMHSRLWAYRKKFATDGVVDIGFFGDSMLSETGTKVPLLASFIKSFGLAGYSFLEPYDSGGATKYQGATGIFTHWFSGTIVRLSASGHTATVNVDNAVPVEANTIKLYYVTKPGGGTFKVQTRKNSGTWTDEASYLTVSSNGTLAGSIITITKTDIRALWDIRAVWVSGGEVDIIGGALYQSVLRGARLAFMATGSTDMSSWVTASTAVCNPILTDMGVDLAVFSHLDGESGVNTYQATFQDFINTAIGTAPSWLCIGPPVGPNTEQDDGTKAQASAMKALADTRRDAFWDNRRWAGTPAQAVAAGLHVGTSDPHYENIAASNWIPRMIAEIGLVSTSESIAGVAGSIRPLGGPEWRRDHVTNSGSNYSEHLGILRIAGPAGSPQFAVLMLEDVSGPTSSADHVSIYCQNDAGYLARANVAQWTWNTGIGRGAQWYDPDASAGTPQGQVGTVSTPLHSVAAGAINLGYVAKTADYTLTVGDHTVNVTANSPTLTLPTAVGATGQLYVIANTGAGTVTMATTSSQTIDGAAPGTVAAGARLRVQSTGSNWITW